MDSKVVSRAIVYFFDQRDYVRKVHKFFAKYNSSRHSERFWQYVGNNAIDPDCLREVELSGKLSAEQLIPLREKHNAFYRSRKYDIFRELLDMFPKFFSDRYYKVDPKISDAEYERLWKIVYMGCTKESIDLVNREPCYLQKAILRRFILLGNEYFNATIYDYLQFLDLQTMAELKASDSHVFADAESALEYCNKRRKDQCATVYRITNNKIYSNNFEISNQQVADLIPVEPPDEKAIWIWLVSYPLRRYGKGKWDIFSLMDYAKKHWPHEDNDEMRGPDEREEEKNWLRMFHSCVAWLNEHRSTKIDAHKFLAKHPEILW